MRKICAFLPILLHASFAFGYITENVTNGCYDTFNNPQKIMAVFTINTYTCASGYFLPADTLGCAPCPAGATCAGGTYEYNAKYATGVTRNVVITQNQTNMCSYANTLRAKFQINTYTCGAGYYLPAGNDWLTDTQGCTQCPAGSYCAGGTYTFNASEAQGITGTCAAGTFSSAGASSCTACDTGYSSATGAGSCTANTININWDGLSGANATTSCTYGGSVATPTVMPTRRGHAFAGWTFITQ